MEEQIRAVAFEWLKKQTDIYGDVLPWVLIQRGFNYNGQQINLVGQSGIWKPKVFSSIPLSIRTTYNSKYDDHPEDGFFIYKYMGNDPKHWDNAGLREAMLNQVPLIYFYAVDIGRYSVKWPVYIAEEDQATHSFRILMPAENGDISDIKKYDRIEERPEYAVRKYVVEEVTQRLHQSAFRDIVLRAYNKRCAFCMLKHEQLLDAAHIIPDGEDKGEPYVINGLSLCKIHHAAYDNNILGVTPGYIISVRDDVLNETDGPMLKHGIQELNNLKILLPDRRKSWPDKERLEIRYARFREAG
jgi:putative restriction endonuclease